MSTSQSAILPGMEETLTASGKELAEWLCVTPAAVSQWHKSGKIRALDVPGAPVYPLKESVQAICRELRTRRKGKGEGKDLERSLKYWQVEKTKQAVTQWRVTFGKDIALAILERLDTALGEFQREVASADPRVNAAALRLAKALKEERYSADDYGLEDIEEAGEEYGAGED